MYISYKINLKKSKSWGGGAIALAAPPPLKYALAPNPHTREKKNVLTTEAE